MEAPASIAIPPADGVKQALRVADTFVRDTAARRKMMQESSAAGQRSQITPSRIRVATLVRVDGQIEKNEYSLTGKLTVIGSSEMATVRLRGWFKPKMAAQISRRDDGYYLGRGDRVPNVNGSPMRAPKQISSVSFVH